VGLFPVTIERKHMQQYLYSPVEAARVMGLSRSSIYNLLNRGELKSVHIGKSRRISSEHMIQFVENLKDSQND
jgi:excisionase family DNA binding protein